MSRKVKITELNEEIVNEIAERLKDKQTRGVTIITNGVDAVFKTSSGSRYKVGDEIIVAYHERTARDKNMKVLSHGEMNRICGRLSPNLSTRMADGLRDVLNDSKFVFLALEAELILTSEDAIGPKSRTMEFELERGFFYEGYCEIFVNISSHFIKWLLFVFLLIILL